MSADKSLNPLLCARFHRASELIGRRWSGAIIYLLLQRRCRFATLRDAIPDITDRMLSERLQELEEEGIVDRTVLPEAPVRVEYSLTPKGRALTQAMDAIGTWAEAWIPLEASPKPATKSPRSPVARPRVARSKPSARSHRASR
jgi:DNA-binding HxlR family transcriptional regulator